MGNWKIPKPHESSVEEVARRCRALAPTGKEWMSIMSLQLLGVWHGLGNASRFKSLRLDVDELIPSLSQYTMTPWHLQH